MIDRKAFGSWLQKERERRGLTQADLARQSGLSRAVIHKIESGASLPGIRTFIAISDVLHLSPTHLFRQAGLLPRVARRQMALEDWDHLLSQLSRKDQEELCKIAELKIEQQQKVKAILSVREKKAGQVE